MADIVTIAGSPMERSRTTALLAYVGRELEAAGLSVHTIQGSVRRFSRSREPLFFTRYRNGV